MSDELELFVGVDNNETVDDNSDDNGDDNDGWWDMSRAETLAAGVEPLDNNAGEVDYDKGEIKLYNLTIIKGSFNNNKIELRTVPYKKDIFAFREQYLDIDIEKSTFIAEVE